MSAKRECDLGPRDKGLRTGMERHSYVYMLASRRGGALYVGVTSDLIKRVYDHRQGNISSHTKKYGIYTLVYYEQHTDIEEAIKREKQLKAWKRQWKIELIEKHNQEWEDLYDEIAAWA